MYMWESYYGRDATGLCARWYENRKCGGKEVKTRWRADIEIVRLGVLETVWSQFLYVEGWLGYDVARLCARERVEYQKKRQ
jgi:hypothetical protein